MVYDAARHQVLLYGGMDGGIADGDLWAWDGDHWTRLATGGPPARFGAVLAYDPGAQRVLLYGGTANGTHLTDLWSWDGTAWTQLSASGGPGLGHAAGGWDVVRNRLVIHRGWSGTAPDDDTWEWDGSHWAQVTTTVPTAFAVALPSPMVYDGGRGALLMIVGNASAGPGALWQWSGTAWSSLVATPATGHPAAVALRASNDLVMLVGTGASGRFATWQWNGTAFTNLGIAGPTQRYLPRMAYDASRNQLVMFGGMNGSSAGLGDTWTFDGAAWTER